MGQSYIVVQEECYRIAGTRVSLDSLVYLFLGGLSPESIAQSFPVLTLEQVYGAIRHYLAHRKEIDAHLRDEDADFEQERQASRLANADLYSRIQGQRTNKDRSCYARLIPSRTSARS